MQTEQHKFNFENLSKAIEERLMNLKREDQEFYICNRINDNSSFLSIYKDAMFHYVDGVLLCERVYFKKAVRYETEEVIKYTAENEALYKEFLEFAQKAQEDEQTNQDQVAQKLKEYTDKFQTDNTPKEQIQLPYYEMMYGTKSKILLMKLNDIPDDVIQTMSQVTAEHVISFYRTMFYANEQDYGVVLRGIETGDHIDIVAAIVLEQR